MMLSAACAPKADTSDPTSSADVATKPSTAAWAQPSASKEEAERWIARYLAGKEEMRSDQPNAVFVAQREAP